MPAKIGKWKNGESGKLGTIRWASEIIKWFWLEKTFKIIECNHASDLEPGMSDVKDKQQDYSTLSYGLLCTFLLSLDVCICVAGVLSASRLPVSNQHIFLHVANRNAYTISSTWS